MSFLERFKEFRPNVLILTLLAVGLCWLLSDRLENGDLAMLAAGIVGAIGATMTKLVDPPAPPPDPAVPSSTVEHILANHERQLEHLGSVVSLLTTPDPKRRMRREVQQE